IFFFQAEDGIRDATVTGVQTCALPISLARAGHDVLLVDRAVDHVNAMNAHGLTVDRPEGYLTVPVQAIRPDVLGGGLDLVLLSRSEERRVGKEWRAAGWRWCWVEYCHS